MVEGAPLLREYTSDGIEGSNPFLSAISVCALPPATPKRIGSEFGVRPSLLLFYLIDKIGDLLILLMIFVRCFAGSDEAGMVVQRTSSVPAA